MRVLFVSAILMVAQSALAQPYCRDQHCIENGVGVYVTEDSCGPSHFEFRGGYCVEVAYCGSASSADFREREKSAPSKPLPSGLAYYCDATRQTSGSSGHTYSFYSTTVGAACDQAMKACVHKIELGSSTTCVITAYGKCQLTPGVGMCAPIRI